MSTFSANSDINFNNFEGLEDNKPMTCLKAAGMFSKLKMSIPIVKADYKLLVTYVNTLAQLRSGFYCTICDADFQSQTNFYWESTTEKKFYLGSTFCSQFIKIAVPFVKYMFNAFKTYIETGARLIQCKINSNGNASDNQEMKFEIDKEHLEDYQMCQEGVNNKQGLFSCSNFCGRFDLTTINAMVDGNVPRLREFVEYFRKNKEHFEYPQNNFLVGSVRDTETLLDLNYETISQSRVFFSSKIDSEEINKPNTEIHQSEGVDIFELSKDNKYPLFIESEGIWVVWCILMIKLFFIFGL